MPSTPQASAGTPQATTSSHAHLKSQAIWRYLIVTAVLAVVLLAVFAGIRSSDGNRAAASDIPDAQCSSCFAAPIAPSAIDADAATAGIAPRGNVVLYQPESWDAQTNQNVASALALLPTSVQSQLGNPALGQVLLTVNDQGRTISGNQPYGRPANFFSTNENVNQVVLYPDQSVRTILHELGHAYNLRHTPAGGYGLAYLDPEFQDFMKATSWRVLTPSNQLTGLRDQAQVSTVLDGPSPWINLSRNDPLEDFANSFALYFAAPAELKQLSPARYGWFAAQFAP